MTTRLRTVLLVAAAALAAGCGLRTSAWYRAVSGDYGVEVPWGWNVFADADHDAFAQAVFVGPRDLDFYLGKPSLTVRWYKNYAPHTLPDGSIEMYTSAEDFASQTIRQVYGPDALVMHGGQPVDREKEQPILDPKEALPQTVLRDSGLPALFFSVASSAVVPPGMFGATKDDQGVWHNRRQHEYVLVPMGAGFYVLCYPATVRGHDKGLKYFDALASTFHPYTDGPGGAKIRIPGRQR
jgi:hypothetical protein